MAFWTYILHCNAGVFYAGHTDNLEHRIADHKHGRFPGFTKAYLPVELVWSQEFETRGEAKAAEKQIKGWSRAKKLALVRGDWEAISRLAKSKSSPSTGSGQTELCVTTDAHQAMLEVTQRAHPNEACGILLGQDREIQQFIATRNVHPTPKSHFEIDPQALIDAHRAARAGGPAVLGYFHSHPTGAAKPSETDCAMAARDGALWLIGGRDTITAWRSVPSGFVPLSYVLIDA